MDKFTIAPTHEQFDKCRKDDFLLIADFFDIVVPCHAFKKEIKEMLRTELVKQRILPEEGLTSGVASNLELVLRRWYSNLTKLFCQETFRLL